MENKCYTPIELFGVECGNGWKDLLTPIIDYVNEYNKDKKEEEKIEFIQIKEKYGGLRVYTNFGTKELFDLIEKAEEESYDVCEDCGTRENVGFKTNGWLRTLCLDCAKNEAKTLHSTVKWERNSDKKMFNINVDGTTTEIEKQN